MHVSKREIHRVRRERDETITFITMKIMSSIKHNGSFRSCESGGEFSLD